MIKMKATTKMDMSGLRRFEKRLQQLVKTQVEAGFYDEAEDIIRDLVAKGVPVESIRVYSPDTSQDVHWLEYHLQQLYVKILTPGPALEGLINEVQRLIENYVPTVCEVSVSELTTYIGDKEELRAVDTHEGERGVLRKHLMEEILHAALARTSDEGAIAILQETMRRVDKLTPGNMLSDIYAARSIGEVAEHDGLRKQFIIECLQAASQGVSTTDAMDVLSRARDNIDTLDINGLIKALSTAYTKSASVRRKK